jgi:hypothetical protein
VFVNTTDNYGSQWNTKVERIDGAMPEGYALRQNYPNPFNPTTSINYDLAAKSHVRLAVYNLQGQLVKMLFEGEQIAGSYKAEWNATDLNGSNVPSGVYFYRLDGDGYSKTLKMTLMK